jgi:hypothetical protein
MLTYSLQGYLALLEMRSNRTLLLEGKTDAVIVGRVIHEIANESVPDAVVDTADMIRLNAEEYSRIVDLQNNDVGSRELVELVHSKSNFVSAKFACLVDREFRGFNLTPSLVDSIPKHNIVDLNMFWTRGHSIENYFLSELYLMAFLRFQFAERISKETLNRLQTSLPSILTDTAAITLTIYNFALLSKSNGISTHTHWDVPNHSSASISLTRLVNDLKKRHVENVDYSLFENCFNEFRSCLKLRQNNELARWITHGHLGLDFVWSGIARILEDEGWDNKHVMDVSKGYAENKLRKASEIWAKEILDGRAETPTALWSWYLTAA